MLAELEEHIERRWELNDETWTCLLASWMVAVGVVRHRHLERSSPRKWTRSFVHFRCSKGKQRRNRGGFDFAIPSTFMTGWCWAERWHPLWSALPAAAQSKCGICFNAAGQHWPIAESQPAAREVFFNKIEDVNLLTTYSWRRLMPTVAHTIHVAPEVANALGDWQDASKVDATSKMPLHYSSVRYVESLKSKARCLGALQALQFESWELIPEEAIEQAGIAGTKMVQQLVPRDGHILWSLPLTNTETASRFAASQQMKARAAVVRARAARDAAAMPRSVMNKQVSAFLRDNTLLCAPFQQGQCQKSAGDCFAHQCPVLFKSGRVCGAAKDCREKRFISVKKRPQQLESNLQWRVHHTVRFLDISQRRDIELHRIAYDRGVGSWIKEALQKAQVGPAIVWFHCDKQKQPTFEDCGSYPVVRTQTERRESPGQTELSYSVHSDFRSSCLEQAAVYSVSQPCPS